MQSISSVQDTLYTLSEQFLQFLCKVGQFYPLRTEKGCWEHLSLPNINMVGL